MNRRTSFPNKITYAVGYVAKEFGVKCFKNSKLPKLMVLVEDAVAITLRSKKVNQICDSLLCGKFI